MACAKKKNRDDRDALCFPAAHGQGEMKNARGSDEPHPHTVGIGLGECEKARKASKQKNHPTSPSLRVQE